MRNTFVKTLIELAEQDNRVFLVTADMGFSVLEPFAEKYPDRFLNVGIAEQNAVGVASGLALSGKVVYVYSIIPFVTMRPYEQVRVDVAYMNTNVRLIGVGAGLSYGPAGATHHAIEDIAVMRALPNMTVCCPGDPIEVRGIIRDSLTYKGPMYIRIGKNGEPNIHSLDAEIKVGKAIRMVEGSDVAIFTTSNMLEQGMRLLHNWKKDSIHASLISVPTIKPLDCEFIYDCLDRRIPIITLEEHNIIGGLGSAVAEVIADSGIGIPFKRIAIPDVFSHEIGSQDYLRMKFGLTSTSIDLFHKG